MTPRATSSSSTMSSTSGTPRAVTPRSRATAPETGRLTFYQMSPTPRSAGALFFQAQVKRKSDGRRKLSVRSLLRLLECLEQVVGPKRLLQADHIGKTGRLADEIQRRHAGDRHDREPWNAPANGRHQV